MSIAPSGATFLGFGSAGDHIRSRRFAGFKPIQGKSRHRPHSHEEVHRPPPDAAIVLREGVMASTHIFSERGQQQKSMQLY